MKKSLHINRERVNLILKHKKYNQYLALNEAAERDRQFCRHDMVHFLDVARLSVILNLKEEQEVEEELIYGAALLHDIGRHIQYKTGKPHEEAGALLAPEILSGCGFSEEEADVIVQAIAAHRDPGIAGEPGLKGLLYRADKMSRSCFTCKAQPQCDWKADKKNLELLW